MPEKDIHMRFRDCLSVNLLFAALDKSFPLFRSVNDSRPVDAGGKEAREKVFLTLKAFSTKFPQSAVDEKA
jgi:hypothetical protein